jgi:hypothetical protein
MKNGMETNGTACASTAPRYWLPPYAQRCVGALALLGQMRFAQARMPTQATRMYNRIAGVPPTPRSWRR